METGTSPLAGGDVIREGSARTWQHAGGRIEFSRGPALMGIVNVTPDSFSDGGQWLDPGRAIAHGLELVAGGATILDVGGESTRPGSQPVDEAEELRRVLPVVRELARQSGVPVSIDTSKPAVAREALDAGAVIINDVTGLGNPAMVALARSSGAGICVMHMQGTPQTMQECPTYTDVVAEIFTWLRERLRNLLASGLEPARICLDPGIGFGKTHEHNLALLRDVGRFHELGQPLLVGHSRKGFISKLAGPEPVDREAGTLGVSLHLALAGVQVIRLHEVRSTGAAIRTLLACRPDAPIHCYRHPRPAVAVDLAVLRPGKPAMEILLIQRGREPFAGRWALPGGFVEPDETVETAGARELAEETRLVATSVRQVKAWSRPDRDPRGRVITILLRVEVAPGRDPVGGDDARAAGWFPVNELPPLAFDHAEMIQTVLKSGDS